MHHSQYSRTLKTRLTGLLTAQMFDANGDDSFGLSTAAWAGTLSRNTARKNFFAEDFIFVLSTI